MTKNNELPSEIFNSILDIAPVGITILKPAKHPERWQEYILVYRNLLVAQISTEGANNLGHPAIRVLQGFEETGFTEVSNKAFTTGQMQEFYFHFGNEYVPTAYFRLYLLYLPNGYMANYILTINKEVAAQQALEEQAEKLKQMNEMRVQNELEMVELKREIQELEAKLALI